MASAKKRTGRPAKKPKPGSRVSLGLKVTAQMKELLDAQAKLSGRTQSQEAEFRLEQTFWQEELLPRALRLAYGKTLAGVLLTLGETIKLVGQLAQYSLATPNILATPIDEKEQFKFTSWEDHPVVVRTAFGAAKTMLKILADPSLASEFAMPISEESVDAKKHAQMGKTGYGAVVMILKDLQFASAGTRDEHWEEIREMLGPLAEGLPTPPKSVLDAEKK